MNAASSAARSSAWVLRGSVLDFLGDPGEDNRDARARILEDTFVVIEKGRIFDVVPASSADGMALSRQPFEDLRGKLLAPGFIDTHIHGVQVDVIASPGRDLLDWLERFTFVEEQRFGDPTHARATSEFFVSELLRCGTTTACVFGSVHRASVESLFETASRIDMRMIGGKVLMDQNAPPALCESNDVGISETRDLIEHWHGRGRIGVAITPRFAITSTPRQLEDAGALARRYPDTWVQTHLAENGSEIEWVGKLHPQARDYLDVYEQCGLARERSVFAHCIHLNRDQRRRLAATGSVAAFCPTSNVFLGSGLYDLAAADDAGQLTTLATDVGGGTSYSMLATMAAAYGVTQLAHGRTTATRLFYMATCGAARSLGLGDRIGRIAKGFEADLIVLDPFATPVLSRRTALARTLEERLFALMMLGDDRVIAKTVVAGRAVHER